MPSQKTHILLAFANVPDPKQLDETRLAYLPNLEKERSQLVDILRYDQYAQQLLLCDYEDRVTSQRLFEVVLHLGESLNIIHYSGHAESLHIELEDAQYKIEQLCELIKGYANIRLIFLNGCSTRGMVEKLLDTGVDAVIATSEAIKDAAATKFSIAFYQAFMKKGTSLRVAYNRACSVLAELAQVPENERFVERGSFKKTDFEVKEAVPWRLYYNQEKASILDWQLIDQATSLAADPDLAKALNEERLAIQNVQLELAQLEKTIAATEAELAKHADNPALAILLQGAKDQLEEQKNKRNQLHEKIHAFYRSIKSQRQNLKKLQHQQALHQAIEKLNYKGQLKFCSQALKNTRIGSFVIQGSAQCGHEMLRKRFLKRKDILEDHYQEIVIDLAAAAMQHDELQFVWDSIGRYFTMVLNPTTPPNRAALVAQLYRNFIANELEPQDIIFVFNNAQELVPKKKANLIQAFWKELQQLLQVHLNEKDTRHLLLFVMDKNCQLVLQADGKKVSNQKELYETTFSQSTDNQHLVSLVPIIDLLDSEELCEWSSDQELPEGLALDDLFFEELAGENGAYILPAIQDICRKAELPHLYFELLKKHKF